MQKMIFRLRKKPFHPFSLLLSRWHFNGKILLIFCEFLRPILAWQEQRKWCLVFFHQEGHSALLLKNYQTKPCQFGIYTKSFSYLVQWVSEILIYKSQPTLMGGEPINCRAMKQDAGGWVNSSCDLAKFFIDLCFHFWIFGNFLSSLCGLVSAILVRIWSKSFLMIWREFM